MILDRSFDYLRPYFYSNPYALRCELGIGKTQKEYMKQARERATRIYKILFSSKADAIIFNQWIYDRSDGGDAGRQEYYDDAESALLENYKNYRHVSVEGLKTYDPDDSNVLRNRIVCYSDDIGFDDLSLIEKQIIDDNNSEVSLVSFENECILSVYDDRGCDIVFSTHEKMRQFYHLLEPFFLQYDSDLMMRRLIQTD